MNKMNKKNMEAVQVTASIDSRPHSFMLGMQYLRCEYDLAQVCSGHIPNHTLRKWAGGSGGAEKACSWRSFAKLSQLPGFGHPRLVPRGKDDVRAFIVESLDEAPRGLSLGFYF